MLIFPQTASAPILGAVPCEARAGNFTAPTTTTSLVTGDIVGSVAHRYLAVWNDCGHSYSCQIRAHVSKSWIGSPLETPAGPSPVSLWGRYSRRTATLGDRQLPPACVRGPSDPYRSRMLPPDEGAHGDARRSPRTTPRWEDVHSRIEGKPAEMRSVGSHLVDLPVPGAVRLERDPPAVRRP